MSGVASRMTWGQAVAAMRAGNTVRRYADAWIKRVEDVDVTVIGSDGRDVSMSGPSFESGVEGIFLAAAWTDDDKPVMVFMGAMSRMPFVPTGEMAEATDWLVDPPCREL